MKKLPKDSLSKPNPKVITLGVFAFLANYAMAYAYTLFVGFASVAFHGGGSENLNEVLLPTYYLLIVPIIVIIIVLVVRRFEKDTRKKDIISYVLLTALLMNAVVPLVVLTFIFMKPAWL